MVTSVKNLCYAFLILLGNSAFGNIYNYTLDALLKNAKLITNEYVGDVNQEKMLSCRALHIRLNKIKKYNNELASIIEGTSSYEKYLYAANLLNYLKTVVHDTYLSYFDKNNFRLKINAKLHDSRIYLLLVGSQAKVYFPHGAKDFLPNRISIKISNFDICLQDEIRLYEITNCYAQNISDLELCEKPDVKKYVIKAPRKSIQHLPGVVIGGIK